MFSGISSKRAISQLSMEDPNNLVLSATLTQTGGEIGMIANQPLATSSTSIAAQYHGHRTNNLLSQPQPWKPSISRYRTHLEKQSHEHIYSKNYGSGYRLLSSTQTIKERWTSRRIQQTISVQNTSTYDITLSVIF